MRACTFTLAIAFFTIMHTFAQPRLNGRDMVMLKAFMTGSFSSAQQAKEDSAFEDLRLRMTPIWEYRKDGFWIYGEYTAAHTMEQPRMQRVYHLQILNDSIISHDVFELKYPARFAGAWKDASRFEQLHSDSLLAQSGCGIYLRKSKQGTFFGKTAGKLCRGIQKGTAYITSEWAIQRDMLLIAEIGWNGKDKQVSGPAHGSYRFMKQP